MLVLAGLVAGMNFLRPVSAQNRKQLTLKVGRRLLFASFADTLDDEKENKNNIVSPTASECDCDAADKDKDKDKDELQEFGGASSSCRLVSTSDSSCEGVTALAFVPFEATEEAGAALLVHVSDGGVLEVNAVGRQRGGPDEPLLRQPPSLPSAVAGDCVGIHPFDVEAACGSCKLALGYDSGALLVARLTNGGGGCAMEGLGMINRKTSSSSEDPAAAAAAGKVSWSFSGDSASANGVVAASLSDDGVVYLYDASSFSESGGGGGLPVIESISVEEAVKSACLANGLQARVEGMCLSSSPSTGSQALITTHQKSEGTPGGKVIVWDAKSMLPTQVVETATTLCKILQTGGGHSNNNSRFTMAGVPLGGDASAIRVLDCCVSTLSCYDLDCRIGKAEKWCLSNEGDFMAALVTGEGDYDEFFRMCGLDKSDDDAAGEG